MFVVQLLFVLLIQRVLSDTDSNDYIARCPAQCDILKEVDAVRNEMHLLRQLINQESIVRLSLEDKIHSQQILIQDMEKTLVNRTTTELVLAQNMREDLLQTVSNLANQKQNVSFLAWYSKPKVRIGNKDAVKYNKVLENIGSGYDLSTGKFTAPVSGIYAISVSMMSETTNHVHLGIMKNSQLLAVLFSNSKTFPHASSTLNLFLEDGDTVWARCLTGSVLHVNTNWPYNIFSGALITQFPV